MRVNECHELRTQAPPDPLLTPMIVPPHPGSELARGVALGGAAALRAASPALRVAAAATRHSERAAPEAWGGRDPPPRATEG